MAKMLLVFNAAMGASWYDFMAYSHCQRLDERTKERYSQGDARTSNWFISAPDTSL